MASAASFLDDIISNTEVSESAVSALVGSLESQLTSSTSSSHHQQPNSGFHNNSVVDAGHSTINNSSTNVNASVHAFPATGQPQQQNTNPATVPPSSLAGSSNGSSSVTVTSGVHQQASLPPPLINNNVVHHPNILSNGPVGVQQLPNGTMAPIQGIKMVTSTVQQQQTPIIIPSKVLQQGGTNGAAQVTNPTQQQQQQQVLRPPGQVVQQATVINSTGAPAGVQVVNMNATAVRPGQTIQNLVSLQQQQQQNLQMMNPGGIAAAQQQQRALAPRMVLSNPQQVVGARPGQMGITLQALQGFQAAGAQGHLLVKTETGQYQLLRVGPGPVGGSQVVTSNIPALQNVSVTQHQQVQGGQQQQTMPVTTSVMVNQTTTGTYRFQNAVTTVPTTTVNSAPVGTTPTTTASNTNTGTSGQMTPDTAKVKCKNFLSTLLRLASEQPESVATNVQMLIQGLVDAKVEPEEFTTKLQRELNSSPQPCLIPFLKKSLPYLRHSLATRELTIEGIRPPPMSTVTNTTIPPGQTVVVQQQPSAIQRVQGPTQVQPVRPMGVAGTPVRVQVPSMVAANAGVVPNTTPRPARPAAPKVTPKAKAAQQAKTAAAAAAAAAKSAESTPNSGDSPAPISFTITLPPSSVSAGSSTSTSTSTTSISSKPPPLTSVSSASGGPSTVNKVGGGAVNLGPSSSSSSAPPGKDSKEKKGFNFSSSLVGDNDINDVAAMGGVNLAEESQRILGSTELIGTQIRSCKDENFLFTGPLQRRIQQIAARHGLGETSSEVVSLISHAAQERLKTILEKLAVIAEHRMEVVKTDARYEVQQDVKGQLKFLEELDKLERRRHSEIQREMLLKAAKSRSKAEDPKQAELKAKAKEMQRAEMEELRQREANMTALQAIGVRKKPKLELTGTSAGPFNQVPLRPRVKRVNLRDLLFLLKEERGTVRSPLLYKAYLK